VAAVPSAGQGQVFPLKEGEAPAVTLEGNLSTSGQTKLDGNGNGQVVFKTYNANQSWLVTGVNVGTNNTSAPVPVCGIYVNTPSSGGNLQGATWSGNRALATSRIIIGPCDQLFVVWTGGTPGDTATCSISGITSTRR
jgi:hypothetical protein